MHRTRIKICGLTREEDVAAAVAAGADAIGFVFYPKSPRYVTPQRAAELIAALPPFVTAVGLFVNASAEEVAEIVRVAPVGLLQFHGDETAGQCALAAAAANRPFVRAFRVKPSTTGTELLEYDAHSRASSSLFNGVLLDTFVDAYGGAGKVFDWSVIPKELAHRAVLSGGLSVQNATGAVAQVRPWAVDVSSGVEAAKGIKDAGLIAQFIAAVRAGDATPGNGVQVRTD
ncbi:phosphoribosylanthranilate isomerase [Pseudoduganella umbonata]|uniref:N-(5'-phosphoribosyl)anthranilate isomerase n=1 Tax=Pseudoduganella umbonata TaxID=864828 RepID=A0A4P8HRN3_9BURK|nr:phosphoribosylanthranilate isomerase [Pseudoduganella umbonata]MBB3224350.1 phosphoribosylanthranilate isomerase [Pseudoduganella umbonata]QCP11278.1 phosphoribosylanthranilate isomerase [Pseudoduganella umbonata]